MNHNSCGILALPFNWVSKQLRTRPVLRAAPITNVSCARSSSPASASSREKMQPLSSAGKDTTGATHVACVTTACKQGQAALWNARDAWSSHKQKRDSCVSDTARPKSMEIGATGVSSAGKRVSGATHRKCALIGTKSEKTCNRYQAPRNVPPVPNARNAEKLRYH